MNNVVHIRKKEHRILGSYFQLETKENESDISSFLSFAKMGKITSSNRFFLNWDLLVKVQDS